MSCAQLRDETPQLVGFIAALRDVVSQPPGPEREALVMRLAAGAAGHHLVQATDSRVALLGVRA